MERWLGKYSEMIYAILRIVMGLLFACHGAQKLLGMFGGLGVPLTPLIIAAGIIELFGGALVALGLWAGYAGFITSGQMAAAYFMMHSPGGFWPIVNKGELAVLYCFGFLYIASRGSGRMSVESLVRKRRTEQF
jgi:putative oxidoreductase